MKKTKKEYEEYLNELSPEQGSDEWIIGGVARVMLMWAKKYGTAIRRYDPIGVRYNAIDEDKRRRIADRLKVLKYVYRRDSTDTSFELTKRVSPETYKEDLAEFKERIKVIDTSLFYGSKYLFTANIWGVTYLVIQLHVNSILEENIELFLSLMGATKEAYDEMVVQREADEAERIRISQQNREREAKVKSQKSLEIQPVINDLNEKFEFGQYKEPGEYLRMKYDSYKDEGYTFEKVLVYKGPRQKLCRMSKSKDFKQPLEAITEELTENYSDSTMSERSTIKGWKL